MKQEEVMKITEKYPEWFGKDWERYGGYLEVGVGWTDIISELCTKLETIIPKNSIQNFSFHQIKEKFGDIRIYTSADGDPDVNRVITEAEAKSAIVCEDCGEYGKRRTGSWLKTLCDIHAKERKYII